VERHERQRREQPRLLLQLVVEQADGKLRRVVTDDTWRAHASPTTEDSFYHGETYDARLEMPGWDQPAFDDKDWLGVVILKDGVSRLVAEQGPAIRVTEELPAVSVTQPKPGAFVYDFGQNASGRCRLKITGTAGTRVQLRHAEVLKPDGTLYTDNYRSARATDVYYCKGGGEEIWEPRFTYRGFRYAEVTMQPDAPRDLPKEALVSCVLHSPRPGREVRMLQRPDQPCLEGHHLGPAVEHALRADRLPAAG